VVSFSEFHIDYYIEILKGNHPSRFYCVTLGYNLATCWENKVWILKLYLQIV